MEKRERLIALLFETRELLVSPGNDFSWSSWRDQEAAVAEIDGLLRQLRGGSMPELSPLFAPTGPIQEVSASSGWGDRFLELSGRMNRELSDPDVVVPAVRRHEPEGDFGARGRGGGRKPRQGS